MRMYQVDAFADQLFAGNPAAVLVLEDWLPDALMLAITRENNLAETAFVKPRPDGAWDLRWFAPAYEVDFCGHATLATAHILFTQKGADSELTFHTRVGELRVSKEDRGYRLDIPRLPPEAVESLPREIAGIFSTPPFGSFATSRMSSRTSAAPKPFAPSSPISRRSRSLAISALWSRGAIPRTHGRISCRATLPPAQAFPKIR